MKKNDVFTFTAPNGVEVTGVVLCVLEINQTGNDTFDYKYLGYGQNRLFTCYNMVTDYTEDLSYASPEIVENHIHKESDISNICVCVDYAILPDYDELLARYNDIEVAQAETQSGM